MIAVILAQELIAKSFLGGGGQDLAVLYRELAKRSVVCSDRVVQAYGPCRFSVDQNRLVNLVGSTLTANHNSVRETPQLEKTGEMTPTSYPEVDSLVSSFLPLSAAGILPIELAKVPPDPPPTNQATLVLRRFEIRNGAIRGTGSDFIGDLVNKGLTKPLTFPAFFGQFWFSCALVNCSEADFLAAVAQVIDCKLEVTPKAYTFVPNAEKVRSRFLKSYQLFGDTSSSFEGLRQRALYRAYETAPAEVIQESLTNEKMDRVFKVNNDPELTAVLGQLVHKAVEKYGASTNQRTREVALSVKEGGEVKIAYGYGFRFSPVVELKDGTTWRF